MKAIQQILFVPPEKLKIEHSSIVGLILTKLMDVLLFFFQSDAPQTDIILYIHQAVNIYYYKYTIDGVNVIVASILFECFECGNNYFLLK